MTSDEKREELKQKIEESQARLKARELADKAKEAAGTATEFVKRHPVAAVGGAIAVGLVIGAMTKPGRRIARKAAGRSSIWATLARDAVITYGIKMIDEAASAARSGQDKLEDFSDAAGNVARSAKREATYIATKAGDTAASATKAASRKTRRAVRGFRDRITH